MFNVLQLLTSFLTMSRTPLIISQVMDLRIVMQSLTYVTYVSYLGTVCVRRGNTLGIIVLLERVLHPVEENARKWPS